MLIVTGTIEVGAGSVDRVVVAAKVMAAETRREPGCRSYAFFQDIENPSVFRVYEEWDDEGALAAHFQTAHMAAFNQTIAGEDLKSVDVVKFEPGPASKVA